MVIRLGPHVERGVIVPHTTLGNLSTARALARNIKKQEHTLAQSKNMQWHECNKHIYLIE
jgi:hypothetical protein